MDPFGFGREDEDQDNGSNELEVTEPWTKVRNLALWILYLYGMLLGHVFSLLGWIHAVHLQRLCAAAAAEEEEEKQLTRCLRLLHSVFFMHFNKPPLSVSD